jgi:multicomponent Na+:H+ antiporter subunit E
VWPLVSLVGLIAARIVAANARLTRRIFRPSAIKSGMVVTSTVARSDGELTSVGLLTSLIVNSQLVDLDRRRAELQYHVVDVDEASRADINGPVEDHVLGVTRR